MLSITNSGKYNKTRQWLDSLEPDNLFATLEHYGQLGVQALARATPTESGLTASSWSYNVVRSGNTASIEWYNTNTNRGSNIAILLQYGHGTGTGGYVRGRDYINPAIQPVMDRIVEEVWKKVQG